MVKFSKMVALVVVFLAVWGLNSVVIAQQNHALLDKVAKVYKAYDRLQADFSVTYYRNEQDLSGQSEEGKLYLDQKTGKYRISTRNQEMISDGKTQWAVLKDADEVQITEVSEQEDAITPFTIFSFFTKGFNAKSLADAKVGSVNVAVVELTPTDPKKNYSKVVIRVNKANHQVVDVTVHDKNKSRYRYQIKNLTSNPAFTSTLFVFNKQDFPGMEIIDLR